jgi:hypothetical protein
LNGSQAVKAASDLGQLPDPFIKPQETADED